MDKQADEDITLIEQALHRFVQAKSRPRAWERLRAMAGVDLDRAGVALLYTLEYPDEHGCRLGDIAQKMGIEAPSVSRKVQQLEEAGLVERVGDPQDRRAARLSLTPRGREAIRRVHEAHHRQFLEMLSDWPPGDRATFARLFDKLSQNFDQVTRNSGKPAATTKGAL